MNLETSIYQALLKLYPRDFRNQYGEEMTRVFQESLRNQGSSFGFWIRTFGDVISSASHERIFGGWNMRNVLLSLGGIAALLCCLVLPILSVQMSHRYAIQRLQFVVTKTEQALNADLSAALLTTGTILGTLAIIGVFLSLPASRTRTERFGFLLLISATVAGILLYALFRTTDIFYNWINQYAILGHFFGAACMAFGRIRKHPFKEMPLISKLLTILFFFQYTSSFVQSWAMREYGFVEYFRLPWVVWLYVLPQSPWLPLAWIMLTSQKPSLPSRAQPV